MIHGYGLQTFRSTSLATSITGARQSPESSKARAEKFATTESQSVGNDDSFETSACLPERNHARTNKIDAPMGSHGDLIEYDVVNQSK